MNNCTSFKSVCETVHGCVHLLVVYKYYISGSYDNLLVLKTLGSVQIHEAMIQKLPPVPELPPANGEAESVEDDDDEDQECEETLVAEEPARDAVVENAHEVQGNANAGPLAVSFSAEDQPSGDAAETQPQQQPQADVHPVQQAVAGSGAAAAQVRHVVPQPPSDSTLTFLAIALTIAILALIIKKLMRSQAVPESSIPPNL